MIRRRPMPQASPYGPSILAVMDAPKLLGDLFTGPSWGPWRAFLAALFGLPMTAEQVEIFRQCAGRTTPPTKPFREAALIIGRRGGKSRTLALIATFLAVFKDYQPHLAPGEVPVIAVIAADRRQAKIILNYTRGLLRAVDVLADLVERDDAECIEANGVSIEISTGSIASPRGRTYAAVLCDEIAFWRSDEGSRNPDTEVLNAVRPGLASLPGSILLMASSPYARRGALWSTYRRHHGKDDSPILVWKASTLTMNPGLDRALVDAAYIEDEASAAAEYGAEFRSDIDAFISREVLDVCTIAGRVEVPPSAGISYRAFVDPSGGSSDSFTLAIAHRERDMGVLDAMREFKPPFGPESAVQEIAALLVAYGITKVVGDRYGGEWPRERFREAGITYEPSDRSKSDIYRELLPLLNGNKAELLDVPRLQNQLTALERRTARGGRDSIDHAPGAHDDLANAVAGALVLVAGKSDPMALWRRLGGFIEDDCDEVAAKSAVVLTAEAYARR